MARTKALPKRLERAAKKEPMLVHPPVTASDSANLTRLRQGPLVSIRPVHRPTVAGGIRRPTRYKPGKRALLEIRKYQRDCDLLIPRASFGRLVREISAKFSASSEDRAWEAAAVEALQYAAETHLTCVLSITNDAAMHANRQTIQKKDMDLLQTWEKKRASGV